jgi:UDP-N-acetylmuramyl pentapeptide phosphotransferase/UDP-N-acetylglucosamine-1-phosphate transferase
MRVPAAALAILPVFAIALVVLYDSSVVNTRFWVTLAISIAVYFVAYWAIPRTKDSHIRAHLSGVDINKSEGKQILESMGLESCGSFIVAVVALSTFSHTPTSLFPGIITIIVTTLLGFADDVLDILPR